MIDQGFFPVAETMALSVLAEFTKATMSHGDGTTLIKGVASLDDALPGDITFFDNAKYIQQLKTTRASACFVSEKHRMSVPAGTVALVHAYPHAAFISASRRLFANALRPRSLFAATGVSAGSFIHPQARVEAGAIIDPNVVIGPEAEVGSGTVIQAGVVVGPGVCIGRDCAIGAHVTLLNCYIGNRVIIHSGVRIGQDGFGYQPGKSGHLKVPQVGRVIIQDDVEIGANTAIDRGAIRDTVIGEGTKIDNLVQIAHNVVIGRHCIIVSQVGISGSATLGDFVMLGGQVGVNNHVTIHDGAQIAATSSVKDDVPAGQIYGGAPAKPVKDWFREVAAVQRLGQAGRTPAQGK